MILVTGASGFVGENLIKSCENTIACPSLRNKTEDEIKRIVARAVAENGVDTIIHTAAISDIGVCQKDPEASYIANLLIPVYLTRAAKETGIKIICFSSDQVYTGLDEIGPYTEKMTDGSKPTNIYAEHKLEMEQRVLDIDPYAVLLRAEWMYGYYLRKSNYFMNMINATGVIAFSSRQFRGITYVKEVAENMEKVIKLPGGVYNFGSETTKSMYDITVEFLTLVGRRGKYGVKVEDCEPRHNLWMNCEKARKYGVIFQTVEDGLKECAEDYGLI